MNGNGQAVKLNDLYQEVILDHNKRPRNYGKIEHPSASAHGHNPLCGDDYRVTLTLEAGKVKDVKFEGSGCAISKASASMMTEAVREKSAAEAGALKDQFLKLVTDPSASAETRTAVGRLKIFEGVREFPVRVKCAALAWRTLEEALKNQTERKGEVTTE